MATPGAAPPGPRCAELETILPILRRRDYQVIGAPTDRFNCIAFAAGDTTRWWMPTAVELHLAAEFWPRLVVARNAYWPPGIDGSGSLASYIAAFGTLGYQVCDPDPALQPSIEKIALYAFLEDERAECGFDGLGDVCHVARQLPDGRWASKCGEYETIAHNSPHDLVGTAGHGYGIITRYMSRARGA